MGLGKAAETKDNTPMVSVTPSWALSKSLVGQRCEMTASRDIETLRGTVQNVPKYAGNLSLVEVFVLCHCSASTQKLECKEGPQVPAIRS